MPIALFAAPFLTMALLSGAANDEPDKRTADLIHADLPLFGDKDEKYPQHFSEGSGEDYSFGCSSRVRWGDWKFTDSQDAEAVQWYRFTNYGAFHCYAITREADERDALSDSRFDYSFFVPIGSTQVGGRLVELWALQIGSRPGSSYRLLAREDDGKMITRFTMLQQRCPRVAVRDAGQIDISGTRYCAIKSKAALLALAKAMAKLPPLGVIEHVEDAAKPAG